VLLFLHSAHATFAQYDHPNLGRLVSPKHFARVEDTAASGLPWAADNDCFSGFDEARFRSMLERIGGLSGCRFISCPDVVGDAVATMKLFARWSDLVRGAGPVALVAQDGLVAEAVPWDELDAVFIGGTTEYKLGVEAARIVAGANARGIWAHMGRVTSAKRFLYAKSIGIDSVDGTQFSKWRTIWLKHGLALASAPQHLRIEGV